MTDQTLNHTTHHISPYQYISKITHTYTHFTYTRNIHNHHLTFIHRTDEVLSAIQHYMPPSQNAITCINQSTNQSPWHLTIHPAIVSIPLTTHIQSPSASKHASGQAGKLRIKPIKLRKKRTTEERKPQSHLLIIHYLPPIRHSHISPTPQSFHKLYAHPSIRTRQDKTMLNCFSFASLLMRNRPCMRSVTFERRASIFHSN